ncbi:Plant protein 1589 of unknown function [Striga hermonthica]|uniref:Angiotensin-converting enzyme 2 n=1 Tax=Striga hermonthica TaxID=68872 RepID=A0A9N7MTN7_STRHE|nr:Plant protein 1589 of unknown function [Striga hermonthica]
MSNGDVRKVSLQDIQLVQNLIERCLQLYMSQREVVNTLLHQAKIEPGFTELVWQKLEAENQEFFRAYHLRLRVKDQILQFNQLLERQVELMRQITQPEVFSVSHSNGSHIHPMHNNTAYRAPQHSIPSIKPENLHQQQVINSIPDVYSNGSHHIQQQPMQVAVNIISGQCLNTGLMQESNVGPVKAECGYTSDPHSPLVFGAENNLIESHNPIGDASSSFNGGEMSSRALNEILENETNSFGIFGQMSRNFSLSDLTAGFSNDILESYPRSPFLGTDANFMDTHIVGEQQGMRTMNSVSGEFSYEDFASN